MMTPRSISFLLGCLITAGCASGVADRNAPEAKAVVEVSNLAPAPGAELTERSVLSADVAYVIENFQSGVDDYLAPLFASSDGDGVTFNELVRISDAPRLATAKGRLSFRYPVDRELRSANLARPVRVWLFVMERTGPHTTRVIGTAGPYAFGTGNAP